MKTASRRIRITFLLGLLLSSFELVAGDAFVVDDQVVSDPAVDLLDPEFDADGSRIVWQDTAGQLWVADVDPQTGALLPTSGQGQLIDTGLAAVGITGNGPEWGYGELGTFIAYTRLESFSRVLAAATQDAQGVWSAGVIVLGAGRWRPEPSPPANTGEAMLVYIRDDDQLGEVVSWRPLAEPAAERTVSVAAQGGRWLGAERSFISLLEVDGVVQLAQTDIDTEVVTQITRGQLNKLNPFIWYAPEYRDLAFVVMLNFTSLGIYRRIDGQWTRVRLFTIPSDKPLLSSPEAFTLNGRSYISVVTADELAGGAFPGQPLGPSEIWIASVDAGEGLFRRIDDPGYAAQRGEPEPYLLPSGPVVYYTERDEPSGIRLLKRAATGLGPDLGYDAGSYGGAWSALHRDNRNSGSTPFAISEAYSAAYQVAVPNVQYLRPTLGAQGNLYFTITVPAMTGDEKALVAVDTHAGAELFRVDEKVTSTKVSATSALIDAAGDMYVPANEAVSKFTANGERVWRTPIAGLARGAQFAPDGNLVFFTWNGVVYVVDPADGRVLLERNLAPWRVFPPDPSCLSGGAKTDCAYVNAPAVDPVNGVIYATMIRARGDTVLQAFAYDASGPELRSVWRVRSPVLPGIATAPVLSADYTRVYVQDGAGNLVAVDAGSGAVLWRFALGFVSEWPPVVNAQGHVLPGGTRDQSAGYDFVGLVEDLGGSAQWLFQDPGYAPVSFAAAGASGRFVVAARTQPGDALRLLVLDAGGVVGASTWGGLSAPQTLKGLTVREDGWVFVQAWGQFGVQAFQPLQ